MMSLLAPVTMDPESLAALCARAMTLRHREPGAALELAERALSAATAASLEDDALRRRALATLGACLAGSAEHMARGRELLQQALLRCEAAADDGLRCDVLCELAASHVATLENEPAVRHARGAVELALRLGEAPRRVRALRVLGMALTRVGDYGNALTPLLAALELHEAHLPAGADALREEERWERGELFSAIAIVYSNMDQFGQALWYHRAAIDSYGDRFPAQSARVAYRMGIAAEEMDDVAAAEEHYRAALESYERLGDPAGVGLGRLGVSMVLVRRGAAAEAEPHVVGALAALAGDPLLLGYYTDALWTMGDVHLDLGRHDEALASYGQALELFDRTARPPAHRAILHRRFSRAYAAMGRWEEALREHERYHESRVRHLEEQANTRMAAMMVQFDTERALKDREIHRLRTIELEREIAERKEAQAALARAHAELEARNRELHALTIRDPLTGVFNRRYLDQRLEDAIPLAVRGIQPLSVLMCDLDDFKRVNDTFSHAVGDEVLREVAAILRQHVRQSDVVARMGGEEFVVLFPATRLEQARAAAEKVCVLVREHAWDALQPGLTMTMSVGVAEADGHTTPEQFLAAADARLYEAKRLGRDCVVG